MSTFIELEIQNLLNQTQDLDEVAARLTSALESSPDQFTSDNITAYARFLNASGRHHKLTEFILHHLDNENFPVPWPYFFEALGHSTLELDAKTVKAVVEGVIEAGAESEASRSQALNKYEPLIGEWRSNRKYKIHRDYSKNKKALLDQLITLRTQQLYEQEKNLLQRLQKLYPGDNDIQREVREHQQRYALEILSRRSPKARTITAEDLQVRDPQVEETLKIVLQSMLEHAEQEPDMAFDFAVAAFMLEGYEEALAILKFCEPTEALLWLHLEVLLKCRRFVELLTGIAHVELSLSHDPETFFATAYLRAQALWGLGQKHTAIEVMEGLLASRPHYRAASALLSIWSGQ
ncbi:hypothetical protein [Bdellovibrio sp. NC01]|uniref:hypothetical protein n=1 Tax=Bdellovibrio sp. NC01 TaxID=2220073 RepID=UPI00115B06B0|nr:hypothetical protein [Bdellovibrio sp. NC01]QDK38327.1 hypothetical protein DOE51_12430 [Bdellovibrio sp. NC01]